MSLFLLDVVDTPVRDFIQRWWFPALALLALAGLVVFFVIRKNKNKT